MYVAAGGQSKRVNIGIALVSNTRVLFMDEPTSGKTSNSQQCQETCLTTKKKPKLEHVWLTSLALASISTVA